MATRSSQAAELERNFEAAALEAFERSTSKLTDPRRGQGKRYPLRLVVVTALMSMVCGADDAETMALWSAQHADWLSTFLDMPHGTPTQDVYLRVFAALDPVEFRLVFMDWVKWVRSRLQTRGHHIAVDGKASRGTRDSASGSKAVHTVSAWMVEEGLVLGQTHTDVKSNEIKAIPALLSLLELRNATVTIDAMGCQRTIASLIVKRGGNYILNVKDNQPMLAEEIEVAFNDALDTRRRPKDEPPSLEVDVFEEFDKGHGRVETRRVYVCKDLSWITTRRRWSKLAFIVMVVRERTVLATNTTSKEVHYYIGSNPDASAEDIAKDIRSHWAIENCCHWVLDVAFREDTSRQRAKNAGQNFTVLRHFALSLLKLETSQRVGVANQRKLAGWSHDYLLRVLTGPAN